MPIDLKNEEIEKKYDLGGSGKWLKLVEGDNKVRIVSQIEDFGSHFIPGPKPRSVVCIGKDTCPYCNIGEKASVKFMVYAIDRKDGLVKILQFGYTIFKQYKDYALSEDYGFEVIPDYDMNIKRTGTGKETEYNLIPARKPSELTVEEQASIDKVLADNPLIVVIESMKKKVEPVEVAKDDNEIRLEDIPF